MHREFLRFLFSEAGSPFVATSDVPLVVGTIGNSFPTRQCRPSPSECTRRKKQHPQSQYEELNGSQALAFARVALRIHQGHFVWRLNQRARSPEMGGAGRTSQDAFSVKKKKSQLAPASACSPFIFPYSSATMSCRWRQHLNPKKYFPPFFQIATSSVV